jgi:lipoyl(octanoyl) transferase
MSVVCLVPFRVADGPHNMAADEALLEMAGAGRASLRFYDWLAPTLSLGYFQPHTVHISDPLLANLPYVRRPTGGAALVHHHELTYALALPSGTPWQCRGNSWLLRMHTIIAEALAELGAVAESVGREAKYGDILCFLHHTPGDLRIGSHKIVGSAQRRQRGALLQHGAVLLAASPHTPGLPGLAELSSLRLSASEVAGAVKECFVRRTGWGLQAGDWTEAECRRIDGLAAAKYSRPTWNDKR